MGNLVYYCLVFALFRGDCIIPPHDALDCVVPWLEMFRQNHLFLAVDSETPCFLGLSTANYALINFSFQIFLFAFFESFTAFALNYVFAFFLSFVGMALLLEAILHNNTFLNLIVALVYAGLPVVHTYAIPVAAMPFLFWAFYHFYTAENRFAPSVLLLLFFPFFSQLPGVGVFLLAVWAISILIFILHKRALPVNLLLGLALLCIGSIAVEWRLFYAVLFGAPSNRSIFTFSRAAFFPSFLQYFRFGYYHVASLQYKIVLPLVELFCIIVAGTKLLRKAGVAAVQRLRISAYDEWLLLLMVTFIVLTSAIGALYDTNILTPIIREYLPFLHGFNWGRFWILNRVFWYIAFAVCLKMISQVLKWQTVSSLIAMSLALSQMFFIATGTDWSSLYNYASLTWINELSRKPNDLPPSDSYISYDEFYSVELFAQIKEDIDYSDEHVAAVGFHPGVLMYNGFHCIDGYLNSYELSYMQTFRTLIQPELDQNEAKREYYDSWGGRMYLYNEEAPFAPTWTKVTDPITLNIDPDVMRDPFELRYLISRAPIANLDELNISLVQEYHAGGLYDIYVYQVH